MDIGDDSRAAEKLTAITELVIRRAPQLLGTFGYTPTPTPTPLHLTRDTLVGSGF